MNYQLITSIAIALNLTCITHAQAEESRSTIDDQKSVAVTIYNQDLALIKESRSVNIPMGRADLALRDVSARMRPETASLRSLTQKNALDVIEQNFDFDLLTPAALLQKYVGRSVNIIRVHPTTGAETSERAEVLSAASGVVLKIGNRIETGIPGRIVYDEVPDNLRDRPTLVTSLFNNRAGPQEVELSYLSGGLGWHADYVAELDGEDKSLSLQGWVTLTNQSGATYCDATLQLVAGDVNRVPRYDYKVAEESVGRMAAKTKSEPVREESLFEYHLYTLPTSTTIKDKQTKQVSLLAADRVGVKKELVLNGFDFFYRNPYPTWNGHYKVAVMVNFDNKDQNGLGKPLPKGAIRVYKRDSEGRAQFVGEDRIDHTPKNETVKMRLGNAFDVTAERKQTDWRKAEAIGKYHYASTSSYEIRIKNAKKEPVTVTVREPIPGDWQILKTSHKFHKDDAHTAEWKITVPPEKSALLTYQALVRY